MKGLNDHIRIAGGKPLEGTISIQGSKNAALPMMAASLLHRGVSVLKGCPRIADVLCMEEILQRLGAVTWWEGHDLYMDCTDADKTEIPAAFTGKMRSSVVLLGAMLSRSGRGYLGYPGGCVIGKRPIDLHLMVLRSLGAEIEERPQGIAASCKRFQGAEVTFPKRSVGATQQGILAAVLARGETELLNCACEPEVKWLCVYLRSMGAVIRGEGTSRILITGIESLGAGNMQVPPDRIVAGTYICAAAITRGKIVLENHPEGELDAFLEVYRKMGGQYQGKSGKLIVDGTGIKNPVAFLETEVYPGFPTDLQSPLMAVLATIPGKSRIREQIFEDRYKAAEELVRMGAHIRIEGRDALIEGGYPLRGCRVYARELRGGAALILAALAAEGTTCVEGYSFIRRGYEHICQDLGISGVEGTEIYESIQLP
ncbi:UDP-N-acetylglucosamine 1-carboxyvinyltransferase [Ruminococcus sp. 5_1_39BFAA]|uniref:UDP-N-acetylglucosamine 1-carboxyvinyltransferase n=1 Tax=Ruminococcus sp. 5_1_39BFAA TaxID=457412 RepID=UPI00356B18D2